MDRCRGLQRTNLPIISPRRNDLGTTAQLENEAEATIEFSHFLVHVTTMSPRVLLRTPSNPHLYCAAPQCVEIFYISSSCNKGCSFLNNFDTNTRQIVLSVYFLVIITLKVQVIDTLIPKQPGYALLLSKKASVLPCLVVKEQTRFTLMNSKNLMKFINLFGFQV